MQLLLILWKIYLLGINTLIWETARPYIYMRTTVDNRIIIGGLDEDTNIAQERDSKLIHKKRN